METRLIETSATPVKYERMSSARHNPEAFLRWCRTVFNQRFNKDVFFIIQNDERDARNMADFLDSYLTNELRNQLGGSSAFFRDLKTVRNRSRKRELVDARHMMMRLLHDTNITLSQTGAIMGGRDHTTVIHALKAHEDLYDTNPAYRNQYEHLKHLCINEGFIFSSDAVKDHSQSAIRSAEL